MSKIVEKNVSCLIAFGGNLSNPRDRFLSAIEALGQAGVNLVKFSRLYRSPAWPEGLGYPDYLNAVGLFETDVPADTLMRSLLKIETAQGRERSVKNAPRTLDLDLLDYAGQVQRTDHLTLPHPRLMDRAFVLVPLLDVVPDWVHPHSQITAWEGLLRLPSQDVLALSEQGELVLL